MLKLIKPNAAFEVDPEDILHSYIYSPGRSEATQRRYSAVWKDWEQWLCNRWLRRNKEPGQATAQDAAAYIADQIKRKGQAGRFGGNETVSSNTIKAKIVILRAIYNYLRENELVTLNPFSALAQEYRQVRGGDKRPTAAATDEEVRALLELHASKAPPAVRNRALLALLFGAGLRPAEALGARIAAVDKRCACDGQVWCIQVIDTKSKKPRCVPLPDWAAKIISEQLNIRATQTKDPNAYLINEYHGRKPLEAPVYQRTALRRFKAWCEDAGASVTLGLHSGRATFCTKLLSEKVDRVAIKDLMGHSSLNMVEVYDKRNIDLLALPINVVRY